MAFRMSISTHPAIYITNVLLLPPSGLACHLVSLARTSVLDMPLRHTLTDRLNVPGFRDNAVKEYCAWR
jgi:hypothetical protein